VSQRAAHHAQAPPVFDDSLRDFGAWTVEAVKRASGQIEEELRPIVCQSLAQAIEQFERCSNRRL
jgi:hypothetical protein